MTLHKEFEWKSASDVDEGETRIQNTKVTVRSSHFQQKLAKENDEENQNEKLLGKEDVSTDKCENVNPHCENKSASAASEVKTRIKNRKTTVRGSYFPHKSVNERDQDNRQEKLLVKANLTTSTCQNAIPESAFSDDSCFNNSILKRKIVYEVSLLPCMSFPDLLVEGYGIASVDVSMDGRVDVSVMWGHGDGYCATTTIRIGMGIASNVILRVLKLSCELCDESNLGVRKTRCFSSGSRASGLCAPLKDVQNTFTSRSNVGVDLNKFAYAPTNRKASSEQCKR
ncbi:uncharacterized protein LOC114294686 [Camellia sinensis]|uniref:uncharacterized protein LOC114294686 n=1 Tax=Camellia sinensis TaxID=4442 RepID=UPI001035D766|nr:uncharacterized protein LOC114294686 [Camellia sinensis]